MPSWCAANNPTASAQRDRHARAHGRGDVAGFRSRARSISVQWPLARVMEPECDLLGSWRPGRPRARAHAATQQLVAACSTRAADKTRPRRHWLLTAGCVVACPPRQFGQLIKKKQKVFG
jgi:hypothetical protein